MRISDDRSPILFQSAQIAQHNRHDGNGAGPQHNADGAIADERNCEAPGMGNRPIPRYHLAAFAAGKAAMAIQAALYRDELSVDLNTIHFPDPIPRDRPNGFRRGQARQKNGGPGADGRGGEMAPVAETRSYGTGKDSRELRPRV